MTPLDRAPLDGTILTSAGLDVLTATGITAVGGYGIGPERRRMQAPEGSSIAEIVGIALPGASETELNRCRITLVSGKGSGLIERQNWTKVRPRTGVTVVIRIIPAGKLLRSILTIVVAIAAIAAGQLWGASLAAAGSGLGLSVGAAQGLIGLGVSRYGTLTQNGLTS